MERWRGKVAAVTGAASGIGAAITRSLLAAGIHVVALDIKDKILHEMAEEQKGKDPTTVLYPVHCDVSLDLDLKKAFSWIESELGYVDIMVNNAGITSYTPVIESNWTEMGRLLNVNVLAPAACTFFSVMNMRGKVSEGHIFFINSVLGHVNPEGVPSPSKDANGWNLYPASKHASVAMSESIRREISRAKYPIRVTSISPGLVNTNISRHCAPVHSELMATPTLKPEDVADCVMYALGTPPEVQITELTVRRTGELL